MTKFATQNYQNNASNATRSVFYPVQYRGNVVQYKYIAAFTDSSKTVVTNNTNLYRLSSVNDYTSHQYSNVGIQF